MIPAIDSVVVRSKGDGPSWSLQATVIDHGLEFSGSGPQRLLSCPVLLLGVDDDAGRYRVPLGGDPQRHNLEGEGQVEVLLAVALLGAGDPGGIKPGFVLRAGVNP